MLPSFLKSKFWSNAENNLCWDPKGYILQLGVIPHLLRFEVHFRVHFSVDFRDSYNLRHSPVIYRLKDVEHIGIFYISLPILKLKLGH